MEKPDLNYYGVQELDAVTMKSIDGGWIRLVYWLAGGLAFELVTNGIEQCYNDFKEGLISTQK